MMCVWASHLGDNDHPHHEIGPTETLKSVNLLFLLFLLLSLSSSLALSLPLLSHFPSVFSFSLSQSILDILTNFCLQVPDFYSNFNKTGYALSVFGSVIVQSWLTQSFKENILIISTSGCYHLLHLYLSITLLYQKIRSKSQDRNI